MENSQMMMTVEEYLAFDRNTLEGRYEYIGGMYRVFVRLIALYVSSRVSG